MVEALCNRICEHVEFQADYKWLSMNSAKVQFNRQESFNEQYLDNLLLKQLQCATTFSLSSQISFRKMAYNIAIMCRNLTKRYTLPNIDSINGLIALVLSRLGNFPAEKKFLDENNMLEGFDIPRSLWFEKEVHQEDNTVRVLGDYSIILTDFQLQLWNSVKEYPVSIVNAPTSAGKSFILQNHIVHALKNGSTNALYIVPTRALIEQVVKDFRKTLKSINSADIIITEVPNFENAEQQHIFVLTQERVQLLLENEISLDLVVIDEAQNVADNARGIILQSVVERIKSGCPNVKFVFATPYVKNPDIFLSTFGFHNISSNIIPMSEAPVSQNLFSITINPSDTHTLSISKMNDSGEFDYICCITPTYELIDERKYLAILATDLGAGQNNIIYGNDPSVCESIASYISQTISCQSPEAQLDQELLEFSDYLKEHLHNDYLLAETIKYGVAYHYGNLPSFIRKGIERLCATGKIKYIVCTSTLLQGINLPAQNIFIMKPTKGYLDRKAIPLNAPDFWNLAGRAGRLTKDFEGNIFLVNLQEWEQNPLNAKERMSTVIPSFKNYVCDPSSGLLDFINNREHTSGEKSTQGLENAFMKLFMLHAEGKLEDVFSDLGEDLDINHKEDLTKSISQASVGITLPYEVYSKNPNVSVFRQQKLYDVFCRMPTDSIKNLIPPHPMHSFSAIGAKYRSIFKMYENHLMNTNTNFYKFYYWLSLDWMRGDSYRELLQNRIDHKNRTRKRGTANVNTEARGLFEDIESGVRFRYVKFSKCYNDILCYLLKESHQEELQNSLPPLHLYLELGASSNTMINLIGMGISRTAATQIARTMLNSSMTTEEIRTWMKKHNLKALNLSDSVIAEIQEIL